MISDTPRTDFATRDWNRGKEEDCPADHARSLERELNTARAELAELRDKQNVILRDYSVIVADLQAIQDEEDSKLGDMANRSAHYAIKAIADLEGALMDASGLNTKLRLELAALKAAAPEPLDRPDRPGWWWRWCPPQWSLQNVIHEYGVSPGKWLPATPPPVPEKEDAK